MLKPFPISQTRKYTFRRLLLIAAVFHILVCVLIFVVGHFQLLPKLFSEHGIGLFALDGLPYLTLSSDMANMLLKGDFKGWLQLQAPFHVRLYSLTFVFPGVIVGQNILAAELLNLTYYLGILTLIYVLARELFNSQSGLVAAAIIAVWPSFLLHTIHLTRDLFSILLALGVVWILTIVLQREVSWRRGIIIGIAGSVSVVVFWLTRGNMWNIILCALALTIVLLVAKVVRDRKVLFGNCVLLLMLVATALVIPPRINSTGYETMRPPAPLIGIRSSSEQRNFWERLLRQISLRRRGFTAYTGSRSDIYGDVQLNSAGDILRFLPRAAAVGFLAPFPDMWVATGTIGRAGRILAAIETLTMYALYVAAIACLRRQRRNLGVWLLCLIAVTGMIALGLVVVNVGALYRLRYLFWILTILIGAEGLYSGRRPQKEDGQYHLAVAGGSSLSRLA